jgi:hypothetical protein
LDISYNSLHTGTTDSRSFIFSATKCFFFNVYTSKFVAVRSESGNKKDGKGLKEMCLIFLLLNMEYVNLRSL